MQIYILAAFVTVILVIIISLIHYIMTEPRTTEEVKKEAPATEKCLKYSTNIAGLIKELKETIDLKKFERVFDAHFARCLELFTNKAHNTIRYDNYMLSLKQWLKEEYVPEGHMASVRGGMEIYNGIKRAVACLRDLDKELKADIARVEKQDMYVRDNLETLRLMHANAKEKIAKTPYHASRIHEEKFQKIMVTRNAYWIVYETFRLLETEYRQILSYNGPPPGQKFEAQDYALTEKDFRGDVY